MDSPPIDNQTEFEAHPQVLLASEGERLVVVVKATFELHEESSQLVLAPKERTRPIRHCDEPWADPKVDSVKYPCDVGVEKLGTDIIGVVTAHAPAGQSTSEFDAYLRVGKWSKVLRIFGLRVWEARGAGISAARPIQKLDVRYDFAWGGRDVSDDGRISEESRNPVGLGIALNPASLTHQLAPQVEDPERLLRSCTSRPPPAGFGAIGRSFSPRRELTGTYDEEWKEFRCPLPPKDESAEGRQCASPGLVARPALTGNEACALLNLAPHGPLQFKLPGIRVQVDFHVEGRATHTTTATLNMVLIDTWVTEQGQPVCVELVWSASTKAPRKVLDSVIVIREITAQ